MFSSACKAWGGGDIVIRVHIQSHVGCIVKLGLKDHILVGRIKRPHHWSRSEYGCGFQNLPLLYYLKNH